MVQNSMGFREIYIYFFQYSVALECIENKWVLVMFFYYHLYFQKIENMIVINFKIVRLTLHLDGYERTVCAKPNNQHHNFLPFACFNRDRFKDFVNDTCFRAKVFVFIKFFFVLMYWRGMKAISALFMRRNTAILLWIEIDGIVTKMRCFCFGWHGQK